MKAKKWHRTEVLLAPTYSAQLNQQALITKSTLMFFLLSALFTFIFYVAYIYNLFLIFFWLRVRSCESQLFYIYTFVSVYCVICNQQYIQEAVGHIKSSIFSFSNFSSTIFCFMQYLQITLILYGNECYD